MSTILFTNTQTSELNDILTSLKYYINYRTAHVIGNLYNSLHGLESFLNSSFNNNNKDKINTYIYSLIDILNTTSLPENLKNKTHIFLYQFIIPFTQFICTYNCGTLCSTTKEQLKHEKTCTFNKSTKKNTITTNTTLKINKKHKKNEKEQKIENNHHNKEEKEEKENSTVLFHCTTCTKKYKTKHGYTNHKLTCYTVYTCTTCKKEYKTENGYNKHILTCTIPIHNTVPKETSVKITKKKNIPLNIKRLVWDTYIGIDIGQFVCLCCRLVDIQQSSFHCGHVVSEYNGGQTVVENLRPICQNCNSSIGKKNMNEVMNEYGIHIV